MIRIVNLDAFEAPDLEALRKSLFEAFGVGCELSGKLPFPDEAASSDEKGAYDAPLLLAEAEAVRTFADDKLLYVTRRKLTQKAGPLGRPPTHGFAQFGGERAVVSTAGFGKLPDLSDEFKKRLAKQAIHEVGHLWELHTCLEAKCAMRPPWAEGYEAHPEPMLCTFCREKSENKIRMAKT